jgi:hypothetical protein
MEEMLCARALKSANGPADSPHQSRASCVLGAGAEKRRQTEYTRGGRCGDLRGTACTGESGEALHGIDGGDWRRGVYSPCWLIADRKYRLALRAAATKSASRSWRTS